MDESRILCENIHTCFFPLKYVHIHSKWMKPNETEREKRKEKSASEKWKMWYSND